LDYGSTKIEKALISHTQLSSRHGLLLRIYACAKSRDPELYLFADGSKGVFTLHSRLRQEAQLFSVKEWRNLETGV